MDDDYTAHDVKKVAGLSYRQLNNWDSKGALPGIREGHEGWRKFSRQDVFALMVCSELRKQFHVPLESVKWIQSCMDQMEADYFQAAVKLMLTHGFTVWLLTDCKTTFFMDSDRALEDRFKSGFFRGDGSNAFMLLRINPIVNRLVGNLKTLDDLLTYDHVDIRSEKKRRASKKQRMEVLDLVRDGDYRQVIIHLKNGKAVIAEAGKEHPISTRQRLVGLIEEQDYQIATITKLDGTSVHLTGKPPFTSSGNDSAILIRQKNPKGGKRGKR